MKIERLCINAFQVSEVTGLSLSTIRKLTRSGKIPHVRVGRRIMYSLPSITDWINQNTIGIIAPSKDGDING